MAICLENDKNNRSFVDDCKIIDHSLMIVQIISSLFPVGEPRSKIKITETPPRERDRQTEFK